MPYVVNGIGTWYYGRKNPFVRNGICNSCGQSGELKSYDTTLFFVFVFIPVVPLGKKRVLDECAACRQHRVLKLHEWNQIKKRDIEAAVQTYGENPADPEKASGALHTLMGYQDRELFRKVADDIREQQRASPKTLAQAGHGYAYFSMPEEAESCYRASLALADDEEIREALVVLLIEQKRPEDARPFLRHIFDRGLADKVPLVVYLATAYQKREMHREVLELLTECERLTPTIGSDKQFQKLRKKSQKKVGLPASSTESPFGAAGLDRPGLFQRIPAAVRWACLAAGLILAAYLGISYYLGLNRTVHLVNGLEKPYTVTINGQPVTVPGRGHAEVTVEEGTLDVQVAGKDLHVPSQKVLIRSSVWGRPFHQKDVVVINPDQTAVLVREGTLYSATPQAVSPDTDAEFIVHTGQVFYELPATDYAFEPFPSTISLPSSHARVKKTRVGLLERVDVIQCARFIQNEQTLGNEAAIAYLRRQLEFQPESDACLAYLSQMMPPGDFIRFLEPGLRARPFRLEWHRQYQATMDVLHPEHDLAAEYTPYLQEEGGPSTEALYLLGRVHRDPEESRRLLERSIGTNPPCAYAYSALAFQALNIGEFEEALALSEKAIGLQPEKDHFRMLKKEALLGLGRHDDLLAINESERSSAYADFAWILERVRLFVAKGDRPAAEAAIRRFSEEWFQGQGSEGNALQAFLESQLSYYEGDFENYLKARAPDEGKRPDFSVLVLRGDLDEASRQLDENPEDEEASLRALLYALAEIRGEQELARKNLERAIDRFGHGDYEDRKASAFLGADSAPDPGSMLGLMITPSRKRIYLLALGVRFPQHREALFGMARSLNHDLQFPYHTLCGMLSPQPSLHEPAEDGEKATGTE
ncbi:MAG: hypothetical protein HYU36_18410 [Planctomycetes bacterium]|nr:hypothetical protein [Planctomycetota bacterium]